MEKRQGEKDEAGEAKRQKTSYDGFTFGDLVHQYYKKLFPSKLMIQWLQYAPSNAAQECEDFLKRREFAVTTTTDAFIRYLSFANHSEFCKMLHDPSKIPARIELGPVYNIDPQKRAAYTGKATGTQTFHPEQRELVFDMDLNAYDDIRTCCSESNICTLCWQLIAVAIKVLDEGLRKDFGFKHILWVFSGRRGVHCWVCDKKARGASHNCSELTNEQRTAVAEYFAIGNLQSNGKANIESHPAVERAYGQLSQTWKDTLLNAIDPFSSPGCTEKILGMLPEDLSNKLQSEWSSYSSKYANITSHEKWLQLKDELEKLSKKKQINENAKSYLRRIVFSFTYPRIDIDVSKQQNHLLKAPFCVHPKTGQVCVPINPGECESFNPKDVPTLKGMLSELDANVDAEKLNGKAESYQDSMAEHTSLGQSINSFRQYFLEPMLKDIGNDARPDRDGLSW